VPFVSKATGKPWAKIASWIMAGKTLDELGVHETAPGDYFAVKDSVLPFSRFSGVDLHPGPEMKSTGEVMGLDSSFGMAFAKSQAAAGQTLPTSGRVFITVRDDDKRSVVFIAKKLVDLGFDLVATPGTHKVLASNNIKAERVDKIGQGQRSVLDLIREGKIQLIINTPFGPVGREHVKPIGTAAVSRGIPCITTLQGAEAAVNGIETLKGLPMGVKPLQAWYAGARSAPAEQQNS